MRALATVVLEKSDIEALIKKFCDDRGYEVGSIEYVCHMGPSTGPFLGCVEVQTWVELSDS